MDDSEDEATACPVCQLHTERDNLQSQGLVMSGIRALFDSDNETIENVYTLLTPYDGHTAIGLAAALLHDLAAVLGWDPVQCIDSYREGLNRAQANSD